MAQRTTEIIVGLFVLAGMGALMFLALQVSGLSLAAAGSTYTVYADFTDTGGLGSRGRVSMAGVQVGSIESIELDRDTFKARVTLSINSDVNNIPADSAAMIRTSGLLGEQYIDISIGGDLESLQPGDNFYTTQSAMNIERLISNFVSGR